MIGHHTRKGGAAGPALLARAVTALALALAAPAAARTLVVGEGGAGTLAEALAMAADGDTVHLGTGEFFECAVVRQRGLVLEGEGDGTVLTDRTCEGKAVLVVRGAGVTVRNLVLARARVADGNGAGIRLEAQGLTVEHVRFSNDQVGLLAGQGGPGAVVLRDCVFEGGGTQASGPTAELLVGPVALLQVERSEFRGVQGTQVATAAVRSELTANRIETGAEDGAGVAVQAGGGALALRDSILIVGPHAPPRQAAVLATEGSVELRGNRLENRTGAPLRLLLNWTGEDAVLEQNALAAGDEPSSTVGAFRHHAGGLVRSVLGGVRHAAGSVKRAVAGVFGR